MNESKWKVSESWNLLDWTCPCIRTLYTLVKKPEWHIYWANNFSLVLAVCKHACLSDLRLRVHLQQDWKSFDYKSCDQRWAGSAWDIVKRGKSLGILNFWTHDKLGRFTYLLSTSFTSPKIYRKDTPSLRLQRLPSSWQQHPLNLNLNSSSSIFQHKSSILSLCHLLIFILGRCH